MRAFALLLLVATATRGLSAEFSYNRCARNGPLDWGKQCQTGKEQSPIDICDEKTMNPRRSIFIENYERQWMVTNTGHALKFTPQPTPYFFTGTDLDLQDLAKLVGRSDDSSPGWMLAQIHCHLGRKEESRCYPMVMNINMISLCILTFKGYHKRNLNRLIKNI